jgi:ribosomal protein S18 acetylase RimI-like enzyme
MSTLQVREVDYLDPCQAAELVDLLDAYARDSAGGGQALSDFTRSNLPAHLAARPAAFSVIAYDGEKPVGLVNCIEGFSTFACRPLVNVHDVVVIASHRGAGVGRLMLERVIELSHRRGACKLTLEVLSGNRSAIALYERLGFAPYQLDPAMGQAQFFQLWL